MDIERAGRMESKTPFVRRTQSYDDTQQSSTALQLQFNGMQEEGYHNDELLEDSPSPLHASFDVSQLSTYGPRRNEAAARVSDMLPPSSTTTHPNTFYLSSDHHCHRATAFTRNYLDVLSTNNTSATAKTPVRPRVTRTTSSASKAVKASGKRTPASARRHRLFTKRLSPAQRAISRSNCPENFSLAPPPSHRKQQQQPQRHFTTPAPFALHHFHPTQQHSEHSNAATATPFNLHPTKFPLGTGTTVANSTILETTIETDDSAEKSKHNNNDKDSFLATQSFGFSSFPASLPRISTATATATATSVETTGISTQQQQNNESPNNGNIHMADHEEMDPPSSAENQRTEEFDEMSTSPIGTPVGRRRLNFNSVLTPIGKNLALFGTPKEVKLHFNGQQCSPIRGLAEEDGDKMPSGPEKHNTSTTPNQSLDGSSGGSSNQTGRPMPDLNAFEGDMSHDHSNEAGVSSPKLLCPPTPVRTPAWVHAPNDSSSNHPTTSSNGDSYSRNPQKPPKFGRQNSLIATKVLATCSQSDLEGRTSLENSLLEEDCFKNHPQNQQEQPPSAFTHGTCANSSFEESPGATTEPETDHASSIRDESTFLGDDFEDGNWLHDPHRRNNRLFDDAREQETLGRMALDDKEVGDVISMATTFDVLGVLGKGTFADVYKVKAKKDGKLYAVKKHRRQFRGRRDREMTLAEARTMQRLQSAIDNKTSKSSYSLYLLFFFQAWQEDGYFFCQTELCCRDTCREMMDALRTSWVKHRTRYPCLSRLPAPFGISPGSKQDTIGRLVPEPTIWKICHDISAGLSHIHSHGLVHFDIKPSNIFLVLHPHFGAMCKIGDFGLANEIGTAEDGQEGDQKYMAPELLSSSVKQPSADMFSLGLTLYELSSSLNFEVPASGKLWHDLRHPQHTLVDIPPSRDAELIQLIRLLISSDPKQRPTADKVLSSPKIQRAGTEKEEFLVAYIRDVENDERRLEVPEIKTDDQTPRVLGGRARLCISPSITIPSAPPFFSSPPKQAPPFA